MAADDEPSAVDQYLGALLRTLVSKVRLELVDGPPVTLGSVRSVRLDPNALVLRIALTNETVIALHGDWVGMRKLATTAGRIRPEHDTAAALELLNDEKDVEIH
jgi:hypothetical protein